MTQTPRSALLGNRRVNEPTRLEVERLVGGSGVAGAPGRLFLARLLVWHLGLGDRPLPSRELNGVTGFIERRAAELIDGHRDRLPPVVEDRMPGGR